MMRVSSHPLARNELIETAKYYEEIALGLGQDFIEAFEAAIRSILDNPRAAPLAGRLTRRKLISRFPYIIYYQILTDELRILAIAHQSRRPLYWTGRS